MATSSELASGRWRRVRFDEICERVERKLAIDDGREYCTVGVRWYGKGAFIRDRLVGADIARKQQWVIRAGDVVYNKLFAWKGAFAIADESVDGHIVSDKFPTYRINTDVVDPELLSYFFRTPEVALQAESLSKGAAAISKLTLNPPQFWDLAIPLPSLPEQHRILEMLNGVSERVARAETALAESHEAAQALGMSLINESAGECDPTPMSELLSLRKPDVTVEPDVTYEFAGVYSFGRGMLRGPIKKGSDFSYHTLTRIHDGEFVYPKLMAWEGAFGVVGADYDGLVVSPEFPVFTLNRDRLLPETLEVYFEQPDVWRTVSGISRGTNVRRRRLHPKTLLAHEMPLPPMPVQLKLRDLVRAGKGLMARQDEVADRLAALMPSLLNQVFEMQ
jgi:type I restriction enzyme S subunit